MARKGPGFSRGHRSDRVPVWFSAGIAGQAAGGGGSTLISVLNQAALDLRPFTIIRTRLNILITSDQSVASETISGAYAKIVVEEEAADAGINSLPTPIAEADASFFVYEPFHHDFLFFTAASANVPAGTKISVDSKAMRKVGLSQDMVGVLELRPAPGCLISIEGRTLVKLH